ncbi:MAG: hypothetical protein WAK60_04990 [Sedimentisphaerales bacterium]
MNVLLIQTILAARNSEGDDTIWVQILVLVILVVSIGIFSLAKTKTNKIKEHDQPPSQLHRYQTKPGLSAQIELSSSAPTEGQNVKKFTGKSAKEKEKDLHSGMELLEVDFLLSIVENTNGGDDEKDITIRKLNFKELLRRGKLNHADSNALKIYAINKGNLYGKDIQCEAIKSLAERTAKSKTGN